MPAVLSAGRRLWSVQVFDIRFSSHQVAASFSELSEAFAARSRKTFDEMAEEMIAPLLRDWMENNLPTLVERLVREEIERVARGAQ